MAVTNDYNPWEGEQKANLPVQGIAAAPTSTKRSVSDINIMRLLKVWPWMILSTSLALMGAWLYLRYTVSVYEASTSISLREERNIAAVSSLFDTRNPTVEKTDLLRSPVVAKWVVDTLKLQYTVTQIGKIKNKDLFGKLAWKFLQVDSTNRYFSFSIQPGENDSTFKWSKGGLNGTSKLGQPFMINNNVVVLTGSMEFSDNAEIICSYRDPWDLAFNISNNLWVGTNPSSSTVNVTYSDILPQRAMMILEAVVEAYNNTTVEYKNKSLVQSIDFIHERLVPLSNELDSIETAQAQYKSSKGFVGTTANGDLYLAKTQDLDERASELNLQKEILDGVDRYINNPNTKEQNLSVVGLNDQFIIGLFTQFMQTRAEREKLAMVATPENPNRQIVEKQLQELKNNIGIQVRNYRSLLRIKEQQLNAEIAIAQGMLRNTPKEEKQLLEQQRQQNIKQSLFLMLLQRREEASIALAGTTVDIRVLSPAKSKGPVSPKSGQLYAMALGIGLMIPLGLAMLKELLNKKVTSKKQLEQMLSVPIIGSIDQTEHDGEPLAILGKNDRSAAAEQIRSIRANLRYYAPKGKPLFVLVTSNTSGEGKTFLSGNLARSFALQGLNVALVEFDMRRPRLAKNLGYDHKLGLPSVLLGECDVSDIVIKDRETPNLHLYPTGITPPNPSELLLLPTMANLKKHFDDNYDVVILDTPPKGLVADAQLLAPWADISLIVVRFNFTLRSDVLEIENWSKQGQMGKMGVIFNGIKTSGYYGYNYYGYNRNYAYYVDNEKEANSKKKR